MHPPNKFGSRFRTYVLESTCTAAVETLEIYTYLSEFTCKLVNAGDIAAIELSHPNTLMMEWTTMATTLSVFNNKGGVGKTTYMFHIAHVLARRGHRVLLVDCDTQGNLTNYCLNDDEIAEAWKDDGNSIYRVVEPIIRGTGDITTPSPSKLSQAEGDIYLVPGDLRLSDFEDRLGDTWNAARGGDEASLRVQSAIHRYIDAAVSATNATVVLIDMGPNLGALNRAVLASSDYFMTPVAPDLFSIQGTENLGNKLVAWRSQWDQIHTSWTGSHLSLPKGAPIYLGYVLQMHNTRSTDASGMTAGWRIYKDRLEAAIATNIVGKIPDDQTFTWDDGNHLLGQIPNLHSLVPYSQEARKPIFDCTGKDGLRGSHQTKAKESIDLFDDIVAAIENVL
ncbi:ParA family protein [Phaeobacter gallaeciensis]|uniref:ParA family protein n=1 Tax=Phaeobacter gallaeciensis TaxID=60890 RepID=UPI0031596C17